MKLNFIDKTMVRFLIVGVINTIVGTSIMFILYNVFNAGYWVASVSNYIVGSIVSYLLNKYYTFQHAKRSASEIFRFILNISICYFLAYGLAKPLVYMILTNYSTIIRDNMSMIVGMGLFVIFNYFGQRYFVFKK